MSLLLSQLRLSQLVPVAVIQIIQFSLRPAERKVRHPLPRLMTSVIDTSRLGEELRDLSPGGADEDKSRYFAAVEGLLENLTEDQK